MSGYHKNGMVTTQEGGGDCGGKGEHGQPHPSVPSWGAAVGHSRVFGGRSAWSEPGWQGSAAALSHPLCLHSPKEPSKPLRHLAAFCRQWRRALLAALGTSGHYYLPTKPKQSGAVVAQWSSLGMPPGASLGGQKQHPGCVQCSRPCAASSAGALKLFSWEKASGELERKRRSRNSL